MLSQPTSTSLLIGRVYPNGPLTSRRPAATFAPLEPQRIREGASFGTTPDSTKLATFPIALGIPQTKLFEVPDYLQQSPLSALFKHDTDLADMYISPAPLLCSDDEDSDGEPFSSIQRSASSKKSQTIPLPVSWDKRITHASLSVGSDGRELVFAGPSSTGEANAGAARTVYPIPPACGIWYYEVEILERGSKAHISIGFAGPHVRTNRLPGWEKDSWGYHADDGLAFAADKTGSTFGPSYGTDDVIGCGIDFSQHRAFYTKNGSFINWVFKDIGIGTIYPSVGLRHDKENVKANFGQDPFRFDIVGFVKSRKEEVWKSIMRYGSDRGRGSSAEMKRLVRAYLAHQGYAKTVQALDTAHMESLSSDFDVDVPMEQHASDLSEIQQRSAILDAVRAGSVETALALIPPSVLMANGALLSLKLRCRAFVEMILREDPVDDIALIECGKKISLDHSSDNRPFVRDLLQRTFGAAAYGNKAAAVRHAIGDIELGRNTLAAEVNRAILRSHGHDPQSVLERAFRLACFYPIQLGILGVGEAAFADIRRELLGSFS